MSALLKDKAVKTVDKRLVLTIKHKYMVNRKSVIRELMIVAFYD